MRRYHSHRRFARGDPGVSADGRAAAAARAVAAQYFRAALSRHGGRSDGGHAHHRHDPAARAGREDVLRPRLSRSAAPGASPPIAETDDGRYLITLTGICALSHRGRTHATHAVPPGRGGLRALSPAILFAADPEPAIARERLTAALKPYLDDARDERPIGNRSRKRRRKCWSTRSPCCARSSRRKNRRCWKRRHRRARRNADRADRNGERIDAGPPAPAATRSTEWKRRWTPIRNCWKYWSAR